MSVDKLQKMDQLIASWQDEIFERLRGWIAINSVQAAKSAEDAPFGADVRRVLDLFLKDARELGFQVDDVDLAVEWLKARGIECDDVRLDEFTGKRMTFFKDPDGLPLEIHE